MPTHPASAKAPRSSSLAAAGQAAPPSARSGPSTIDVLTVPQLLKKSSHTKDADSKKSSKKRKHKGNDDDPPSLAIPEKAKSHKSKRRRHVGEEDGSQSRDNIQQPAACIDVKEQGDTRRAEKQAKKLRKAEKAARKERKAEKKASETTATNGSTEPTTIPLGHTYTERYTTPSAPVVSTSLLPEPVNPAVPIAARRMFIPPPAPPASRATKLSRPTKPKTKTKASTPTSEPPTSKVSTSTSTSKVKGRTKVPLPTQPIASTSASAAAPSKSTTSSLPALSNYGGYTPEDAALICARWYANKEINDIALERGFKVKKGKFSVIEDQAIEDGLDAYGRMHGLDSDQVRELILKKRQEPEHSSFWSSITSRAVGRPIKAVAEYIRRKYDPFGHQGAWTPEQDAKLKAAHLAHGPSWSKIETLVLRSASDCKDRWRKQANPQLADISKGRWTDPETTLLISITEAMQADKKNKGYIDWDTVRTKLGGKRSPQQCMIKWNDLQNKPNKPWATTDTVELLKRLQSSSFQDVSEIRWSSLSDATWIWSGESLRKHWHRMRKLADEDIKDLNLQETIDYLLVKPDGYFRPVVDRPSRRGNLSEPTIEDSDED